MPADTLSLPARAGASRGAGLSDGISARPTARSARNARFFIVGAGRSGTTLLRLILCGHSRLHVAPETWFISDLLEHLPMHRRLSAAQVEHALALITGHYRWSDLAIPAARLRHDAAALPAPDLRQIIDLVYTSIAATAGKARIGDKTPAYVHCLPALAALYPDAKFIHLLRDGRDVALSYIDAGWTYRCYEGARFEWTASVRSAKALAAPDRIFELRYENLVREPEAQTRRLCAFLGEAFEPAMLEFRALTHLVPARERAIHRRLQNPLTAKTAGAWRTRLPAPQCFVMEACLHRDLMKNGYPLRFAGAPWRPLLAVARLLLLAASPLLIRLVPALQRRGLLTDF